MGRRIILVVLMLGALGWAVYTYRPIVSPYFLRPGTQPMAVTQTTVVTTTTAAKAAPVKKEAVTTTLPPKEEKARLVDPFALRIAAVSKQEAEEAAQRAKAKSEAEPARRLDEPKLEGIWIGSGLKAAFISGQVMTEGGIIMGWRVSRINPDSVVLRKGSAVKILKLGGEI